MPTLSERQHDVMAELLWDKRCRDVVDAFVTDGYAGPVPTDFGPEAVLTEYLIGRRRDMTRQGATGPDDTRKS